MKTLFTVGILAIHLATQAEDVEPKSQQVLEKLEVPKGKAADLELTRNSALAKQAIIGEADLVTYAGTNYGIAEILQLLPQVIEDKDETQRVNYFNAVARFGPKLQGKLLTPILDAFEKESSPVVRLVMFEAVQYSNDPRVQDFCLRGLHDKTLGIRLKSGIKLLSQEDRRGFRPVTEALRIGSEREKEKALKALWEAVDRFNLDFQFSQAGSEVSMRERKEKASREWIKWWNSNHATVEKGEK